MDANEVIDTLATKAYEAVRGTSPVTFDDLPIEARNQYRAVAGAVLEGMTPHITALAHAFGSRALEAERKANILTDQLREAREWALEMDTATNTSVDLLTKATPFLQFLKWQGDFEAARLLEAMEAEAAQRLKRLEAKAVTP